MCEIFILRDKKCIEFRDTATLSHIICTHSVAPHKPGRLCTVGLPFLLYEDQSKEPRQIHWLDCNEGKPKLVKEISFTTSVPYLSDMIGVLNDAQELVIGVTSENGIHCYSTTNKNLKWSMAGNLSGMQKVLDAERVTTDGHGHLFVSDYDNRCIQMFSVSDGQYLGCLIKEGAQGLGLPYGICWNSASHSLAVAHLKSGIWSLSMIDMEY